LKSHLPILALTVGALAATSSAQFSTSNPHGKVSTPTQKLPQPTTPGGSSQSLVVGGANDCASADPISGTGSFAVTTVGATTGAEQSGTCPTANNDVWFAWTAPVSGTVTFETCGGVSADSVIAAYDGAGCPTGTNLLACDDDTCGAQSNVSFAAIGGNVYTLQLGAFGSATTYSGTFTLNVSAPVANDDCATPALISGVGSFAFDNTAATTGTQGQAEASCLFFGTTAIDDDVWFAWTAPLTGSATVSLCGGTTHDSKLAVYDGSGCPTASSIACNDDSCGLQSQLSFPCIGGQVYSLQLGSFLNAAPGAGTFTIGVTSPDDCTTPTVISGLGTFGFDLNGATTGTQGQAEPACLFFGTPGIASDVWYTWTAPATGAATLSVCAQSSVDTKVAVYDGAGCPVTATIACNDDACSLQSQLGFAAVAGQTYTIQLGTFPGATQGSGTFTIDIPTPPTGCAYDDSSSENSVGLTGGGSIAWLHAFGSASTTTNVASVSSAYGTPAFPGSAINGTPTTVAIWDDPNDDGVPNDLVLVATVASTVQNEGTDLLNVASFTPPVSVSGVFFVGVAITHGAGEFPAPLDQSQPSAGRAFVAGEPAGVLNLSNISAATIPPTDTDAIGLPGVWLLRADCSTNTGTSFCSGTALLCPCANAGATGHGCANSVFAQGALLVATGSATLGSDTLVLSASNMPNGGGFNNCTFVQGTVQSSTVFGDGLRCIGDTVVRLGTRPIVNSTCSFGHLIGSDPDISVQGGVGSPGTRTYQVFFRNANPAFCPPATFNTTNGVEITWN
jgi:hypothetical protein